MYEPVNGFCVDRVGYSVRPCMAERVSDWLFFLPGETYSERADGSKYVTKYYTPIARDAEFFYTRVEALRSLVNLVNEKIAETRQILRLQQAVARKLQGELEAEEAGDARAQ